MLTKNALARIRSFAKRGHDEFGVMAQQGAPQVKVLEIGEEGSDARKVVCQVVDALGSPIKGSRVALVEVVYDETASAVLAASTEFDSLIGGGGSAKMAVNIEAATGKLGFTVTDAAVESVVVQITIDGCAPVLRSLSFAA